MAIEIFWKFVCDYCSSEAKGYRDKIADVPEGWMVRGGRERMVVWCGNCTDNLGDK